MKKLAKREITSGDGSGGLFLKLKDGESKVGVFRGEIYEFHQVWENGKSKVVEPDVDGAKSRFRLNFVSKEDGQYRSQIFEFGLMVYNQLAEIQDDYDLEKTGLKISRRGTGTDTTYIIIPSKEQPSASALKAIEAVGLNILEHKHQPEEKKVKNYAPGAENEGPEPEF